MIVPQFTEVRYVNYSDVILSDCFSDGLDNGISWGDADKTLVSPQRFKELTQDIESYEGDLSEEAREGFFAVVDYLIENCIYIDLEN